MFSNKTEGQFFQSRYCSDWLEICLFVGGGEQLPLHHLIYLFSFFFFYSIDKVFIVTHKVFLVLALLIMSFILLGRE